MKKIVEFEHFSRKTYETSHLSKLCTECTHALAISRIDDLWNIPVEPIEIEEK